MQIQNTATSSTLPLKTSASLSKLSSKLPSKVSKDKFDKGSDSSGASGSAGAQGIQQNIQKNIDDSVGRVSRQLSQDLEIINGVNTNEHAGSEDASISRSGDMLTSLSILSERLKSLIELLNRLKNPKEQVGRSEVQHEVMQNVMEVVMYQMSDLNARIIELLRNPPDYTLSEVKKEDQ